MLEQCSWKLAAYLLQFAQHHCSQRRVSRWPWDPHPAALHAKAVLQSYSSSVIWPRLFTSWNLLRQIPDIFFLLKKVILLYDGVNCQQSGEVNHFWSISITLCNPFLLQFIYTIAYLLEKFSSEGKVFRKVIPNILLHFPFSAETVWLCVCMYLQVCAYLLISMYTHK